MFARLKPVDEGVKVGVADGDVRTAEGRYHIDTGDDQFGTAKHHDVRESLEPRLAEYVDLVVRSEESRYPVATPLLESPTGPHSISAKNLRI